ncbi:MAG: transcriptional regulator [Spirochaetales bacterium]|nr:transcriptional regulator [Spirochaetales bacterium]
MKNFDYKKIDEILHSRIRLAMIAVLASVAEIEFVTLKEKVGATDGNMSTHTKKLEEAGYIKVRKTFIKRKPTTFYSLSEKGRNAFKNYIKQIENMIS